MELEIFEMNSSGSTRGVETSREECDIPKVGTKGERINAECVCIRGN